METGNKLPKAAMQPQTVMCKHIGEIIIYNNVFLIHASAVFVYFSLSFFLFAIIVPSSNLRKIIRGKSK
jgi:hypothetical protein